MMCKQVICINWGAKYGAPYVNRLYAMVKRNISPPFRFVCFTDNSVGMHQEVDTHPLPELNFELPVVSTGIWPKCRLWKQELADLKGPVLFLDLDLVVTSSLDPFFEYGDPEDVILARDPSAPNGETGQSSVYRFPVGKLYPIYEMFAANAQSLAEQFKYEQRYVSLNAPGGFRLWPKEWVTHFRRDCRRKFPLNLFKAPYFRKGSKVVIFPGELSPKDAIIGRFYEEDKVHISPLQHVINGITGKRKQGFFRHLRHYILPTKWVEEHWRE